jgi:hypothetical protein
MILLCPYFDAKYNGVIQIAVLCNRTDVAHQLIRRENQHMKYKGNCHLFQILTDLRQFEMLVACDVSVQQRKQERLSDAIWNLILGGNCDNLECLLKLGLDINQCNASNCLKSISI